MAPSRLRCAASGDRWSLTVSLLAQEDRIVAPHRAETLSYFPLVIEVENAEVVFAGTMCGQYGASVHELIDNVRSSKLGCLLILDTAVSGSANLKAHRYTDAMLQRIDAERHDGAVMWSFSRCDGHQYHLVAGVSLSRSGVSNALHSAALLMRAGSLKWH